MNEKTYMQMHREEQGYQAWEQKRKNEILRMHDPKKKQEAWRQLFPIMTLDEEYLSNTSDVW